MTMIAIDDVAAVIAFEPHSISLFSSPAFILIQGQGLQLIDVLRVRKVGVGGQQRVVSRC